VRTAPATAHNSVHGHSLYAGQDTSRVPVTVTVDAHYTSARTIHDFAR